MYAFGSECFDFDDIAEQATVREEFIEDVCDSCDWRDGRFVI